MSVTVTIRDLPEDVRDILAAQARERGQSLQAFLLAVLSQQAAFSRNRAILAEVEGELLALGGAGPEAPDAAEIIRQSRQEREGQVVEAVPQALPPPSADR